MGEFGFFVIVGFIYFQVEFIVGVAFVEFRVFEFEASGFEGGRSLVAVTDVMQYLFIAVQGVYICVERLRLLRGGRRGDGGDRLRLLGFVGFLKLVRLRVRDVWGQITC